MELELAGSAAPRRTLRGAHAEPVARILTDRHRRDGAVHWSGYVALHHRPLGLVKAASFSRSWPADHGLRAFPHGHRQPRALQLQRGCARRLLRLAIPDPRLSRYGRMAVGG